MFRTLIVLSALALAGPVSAADLETVLLDRAGQLANHCKKQGFQTVGVLKFLAVKDGKVVDDLGTINDLLARRLEVALILAQKPKDPFTVIADASRVAAKTPGANHLTPDGRKALFAASYQPAWGTGTVKPDAFLTGIVTTGKDLRTMTISFWVLDRRSYRFEQVKGVADAEATLRGGALVELGESFTLRGAFDDGKLEPGQKPTAPDDLPKDKDAFQTATNTKTGGKHPAEDPDAPVKLSVKYNGVPQKVAVANGVATVAEPSEGQKIEFVLSKNAVKQTFGVVLKVNGENTLEKQRLPDLQCRKWILTNPGETLTIDGYQVTNNEVEVFKVLSAKASKEREVSYGPDVGTVTVTVFAEGKPAVPDLAEDAREKSAVAAAKLPKEPSGSFDALKAKLLEDANRGLIVEGARKAGDVQVVKFTPSPTPVMTLTVVYRKK